jgi:multicomponent Na+:H+ antiporter subunit G
MIVAVNIASFALIMVGSFFVIVGALGLMRMPDVYTRMHAAGIIDTVGAGFLILGMCLYAGASLVTFKLVFLLVLFFFGSPIVTHALAQACLHENIQPRLAEDRREITPPPAANADDGRQPS